MLEVTFTMKLKKWILGKGIYYSHIAYENKLSYESAKYVIIPYGTEKIMRKSFNKCEPLKSVTIPKSIKITDSCIFGEKRKLKYVRGYLKNIKHAYFFYDISLEKIVISEGCEIIDSRAFDGCMNLKTVILPKSLKKIDYAAFSNCRNLTNINLENLLTISPQAFYGCKNLKDEDINSMKVSIIDEYVFYGCSSLEHITIPETVTELNLNAFNGCRNLKTIYIPENVEKIIVDPCFFCDKIKEIKLPIRFKFITENRSSFLTVKRINKLLNFTFY